MRARAAASNSSRVIRTCVCRPGAVIEIDASVSVESASFASVQSARSWTSARRTSGSVESSSRSFPSSAVVDVHDHHLVEVDAAESLEAFGRPEDLGTAFVALHDRRVERAAAEVIDRDDVAGREPTEAGVVHGGGYRLGYEGDRADSGQPPGFAQQVELVVTPCRGVGEDDCVRTGAGACGRDRYDVTQQVTHQRFRAIRLARHDHRCRVAEPALGLADAGGRIGEDLPFGAFARDDVVAVERDDRRHRGRVRAERQHFGARAAADRGGGPRRTEVDAERVPRGAHGRSTQLPLSASTAWLESETRTQSWTRITRPGRVSRRRTAARHRRPHDPR